MWRADDQERADCEDFGTGRSIERKFSFGKATVCLLFRALTNSRGSVVQPTPDLPRHRRGSSAGRW